MRLLYATSIRYPSALANRIQAVSMARAFATILKNNFWLGGNEIVVEQPEVQIANFGVKKSWKLAWRVLEFAKKNKITHLYCREAKLFFFIVLYNFLFFRLPLRLSYEVHALYGRGTAAYFMDGFLSFFVHYYFFTTGELKKIYSRTYLLKLYRSIVLPDAVDLALFNIPWSKAEARHELGWPTEKKIIGYTGRFKTLAIDKGLNDILQALTLLPTEVEFVAVGGSEEDMAEYKNKAQRLGLGERAKFFGHVSQKELAVYQKAFDILLMPFPFQNHYAYYMSPLKMFEYMAAERPIIATDLPSVREILNEGNAMIIPPGQPPKLAEAINRLYHDQELSLGLAATALHDVQDYTWLKRAEKVLSCQSI